MFQGCVKEVLRKLSRCLKKVYVSWHSSQLPEQKEGLLNTLWTDLWTNMWTDFLSCFWKYLWTYLWTYLRAYLWTDFWTYLWTYLWIYLFCQAQPSPSPSWLSSIIITVKPAIRNSIISKLWPSWVVANLTNLK